MNSMRSVLLVFDDEKELNFIEANLVENGFQVYCANSLKEALTSAEKRIPNLIVINTLDAESAIATFSEQIKTERLRSTALLSLIELEDYLKIEGKEHFVVRPVRPKLLLSLIRSLMHHEKINWLPSFR